MSSSVTTSTTAEWLESHLNAIYNPKTSAKETLVDDSSSVSSQLFAPDTTIIVNDAQLSVPQFAEDVENRKAAASKVDVKLTDVNEQDGSEAGTAIIQGSIRILRSLKFRIRVGPAQHESVGSFKATVTKDEATRRVHALELKLEDRAVAVNILPNPLPVP